MAAKSTQICITIYMLYVLVAATTSQTSHYVAKYAAKADKLEKELKMLKKSLFSHEFMQSDSEQRNFIKMEIFLWC